MLLPTAGFGRSKTVPAVPNRSKSRWRRWSAPCRAGAAEWLDCKGLFASTGTPRIDPDKDLMSAFGGRQKIADLTIVKRLQSPVILGMCGTAEHWLRAGNAGIAPCAVPYWRSTGRISKSRRVFHAGFVTGAARFMRGGRWCAANFIAPGEQSIFSTKAGGRIVPASLPSSRPRTFRPISRCKPELV